MKNSNKNSKKKAFKICKHSAEKFSSKQTKNDTWSQSSLRSIWDSRITVMNRFCCFLWCPMFLIAWSWSNCLLKNKQFITTKKFFWDYPIWTLENKNSSDICLLKKNLLPCFFVTFCKKPVSNNLTIHFQCAFIYEHVLLFRIFLFF